MLRKTEHGCRWGVEVMWCRRIWWEKLMNGWATVALEGVAASERDRRVIAGQRKKNPTKSRQRLLEVKSQLRWKRESLILSLVFSRRMSNGFITSYINNKKKKLRMFHAPPGGWQQCSRQSKIISQHYKGPGGSQVCVFFEAGPTQKQNFEDFSN